MAAPKYDQDTSAFLRHEPCPECGSRDNLARYASGRGHCHGCGFNEFPTDGSFVAADTLRKPKMFNPIEGDYVPIASSYGIDEKTCRALGIKIVQWSVKLLEEDGAEVALQRKGCLSFDYHAPDGGLWGQKIRYKLSDEDAARFDKDKTFSFPHAAGKPPLWLQHLWGPGCDTRNLVIFEGEGDAAAYYQLTSGKYPVVSIPTGAKGCVEVLKNHYDFLDRFDKITVIFDGDATGREWARNAAAVLPPGKARLGEVQGHKDARTALMAGDGKAITNAYFNAEEFKPEGIFSVADLKDQALTPVQVGIPWAFPTLTQWTYGRREGEAYFLGAGNAVGKTDFCTQCIEHDVTVLKLPTGVIYLEQHPVETVKRVAGKKAKKLFHLPEEEGGYTHEELAAAIEELATYEHLVFGGNFAATAWEDLKSRLRYLAVSKGIKSFWIDNLTALVDPANERQSVETIVKELALLMQELRTFCVMVCHLRTADNGPSHEEGGQVRLSQFKGSRAIGAFAHYGFGLERNTVHEDPEMRLYTTLRCVKDRFTGRASGNTLCLKYDRETGMQHESEFPVQDESGASFPPYEGNDF